MAVQHCHGIVLNKVALNKTRHLEGSVRNYDACSYIMPLPFLQHFDVVLIHFERNRLRVLYVVFILFHLFVVRSDVIWNWDCLLSIGICFILVRRPL